MIVYIGSESNLSRQQVGNHWYNGLLFNELYLNWFGNYSDIVVFVFILTCLCKYEDCHRENDLMNLAI